MAGALRRIATDAGRPSERIAGYRNDHQRRLRCAGEIDLPTKPGTFRVRSYEDEGVVHLALLGGQPEAQDSQPVRIHAACPLGDVFGSRRCGRGARLNASMERTQEEGEGFVLYLGDGQEGGLVSAAVSAADMPHLHGLEPGKVGAYHSRMGALKLGDLGHERAHLATAGSSTEAPTVVERRGGGPAVVECLRG